MEREMMRREQAEKIAKEIIEKGQMDSLQEKIKDNEICFKHNDKEYRVRLLNRADKEEINILKIKKMNSMLMDKEILMEYDLREIYKQRGLNIEEMESHIRKLSGSIDAIRLKQGKAIADKISKNVLEEYTQQIKDIENEASILLIQKSNLLKDSLENLLEEYFLRLKVIFAFEEKVGDKWQRVFKTMEEYNNFTDEILIEKAHYNNILLQFK